MSYGKELMIKKEHESLDKLKDALIDFKRIRDIEPGGVEENKISKTKYLPIGIVQKYLDEVFIYGWYVEVLSWSIQLNSVCVSVRLHTINPATGEKQFQDGLGAAPIQVNQNSKPMDISNIKSAGLQMALPAAKAYALKDAAEEYGKIFGRDVARKHVLETNEMETSDEKSNRLEAVFIQFKEAWEKSDKSDTTKDRAMLQAKKAGVYDQFVDYLKGIK